MKHLIIILFFAAFACAQAEGYWKKMDTTAGRSEFIYDFSGVNDNQILAVGMHQDVWDNGNHKDFTSYSFVKLSTDKGKTWKDILTDTTSDDPDKKYYEYLRCAMIDTSDFFVVAQNYRTRECKLYKTQDGGKSWSIFDYDSTAFSCYDFGMINKEKGYWSKGLLVCAIEDSGKTLVSIHNFNDSCGQPNNSIRIGDSCFFSLTVNFSHTSWYNKFKLFRTIDYGKTWEFYTLDDSTQDYSFIDQNVGFLIKDSYDHSAECFYGELYKTTNGGKTFDKLWDNRADQCKLRVIYFANTMDGYIAGTDYFYRTTDGGHHWIKDSIYNMQGSISPTYLYYFSPTNMIITDGVNSQWQYLEIPVSATDPAPTSVLASPNPFTDVARVNFLVEQAGRVSIVVRNSMGEQVATREYFSQSGEQTFSLSGANLPAGIYFCDITASGKTYRAKAVLVR